MPRNHAQGQVDRSPPLIYQDSNGDQTTAPEGQLESRSRLLGALRCLARGDDRPASPGAATAQLQAFAEENGFVLAPETFQRTVVSSPKERPELASGSEHTVWFDHATKRVIKLTHPDVAGDGSVGQSDLLGYLKGLYLQNPELLT